MNWFGKRQRPPVDANAFAALTERVGELESAIRRLEAEIVDMHARYVKARRVASADLRNQEREERAQQVERGTGEPETPVAGWGARGRRLARNGGS